MLKIAYLAVTLVLGCELCSAQTTTWKQIKRAGGLSPNSCTPHGAIGRHLAVASPSPRPHSYAIDVS